MSKPGSYRNPKKIAAAQNAQEGVVTVADLSVLTGIAEAQLTKYAKQGQLEHYGEYHGKRFFNFEKIVHWAVSPGDDEEAKITIRNGMKKELLAKNCPYSIEKVCAEKDAEGEIKISWKVAPSV